MTTRVYLQRMSMMARMARGGYLHEYEIIDGNTVIGTKRVTAYSRNGLATSVWSRGDRRFEKFNDFIAAYENEQRILAAGGAAAGTAEGGEA